MVARQHFYSFFFSLNVKFRFKEFKFYFKLFFKFIFQLKIFQKYNSNKNGKMIDDLPSVTNEWRDCFFNRSSKVINPADPRLESIKEKNSPVDFYCLVLSSIEGIFKRLDVNQYCKLKYIINYF